MDVEHCTLTFCGGPWSTDVIIVSGQTLMSAVDLNCVCVLGGMSIYPMAAHPPPHRRDLGVGQDPKIPGYMCELVRHLPILEWGGAAARPRDENFLRGTGGTFEDSVLCQSVSE